MSRGYERTVAGSIAEPTARVSPRRHSARSGSRAIARPVRAKRLDVHARERDAVDHRIGERVLEDVERPVAGGVEANDSPDARSTSTMTASAPGCQSSRTLDALADARVKLPGVRPGYPSFE